MGGVVQFFPPTPEKLTYPNLICTNGTKTHMGIYYDFTQKQVNKYCDIVAPSPIQS
jgi:hypothetical protein